MTEWFETDTNEVLYMRKKSDINNMYPEKDYINKDKRKRLYK